MTTSKLNPRSADFQANAAAMQALVDDLREKSALATRRGLVRTVKRLRAWRRPSP